MKRRARLGLSVDVNASLDQQTAVKNTCIKMAYSKKKRKKMPLKVKSGEWEEGPATEERKTDRMSDADTGVAPPYDIDVSVLGSQMQRRHSVGVGGLWLQHGCTHVAAEQELHHLQERVLSLKMKVNLVPTFAAGQCCYVVRFV